MSSSAPFSYTDQYPPPPSSSSDSVKYSLPYADIERRHPSQARLLSSDASSDTSSDDSIVGLHSSNSGRTPLKLAVASLVISIVCLLVAGACVGVHLVNNDGQLFGGHHYHNNHHQALGGGGGDRMEEVCLPCAQIGPNPLDSPSSGSGSGLKDLLTVRYDDDDVDRTIEICCASNSAQFAVLFKMILERQQRVYELAESLDTNTETYVVDKDEAVSVSGTSAVSAHLVFKPKNIPNPDLTAEPQEQEWKPPSESPMSHVREGLRLRSNNKRLLVETSGLYYVYCQFLFSPSSTSSPRDVTRDLDVASAYVRRYSILRPAAPEFLLKSRHTRHAMTQDRHSSYVGGVFRLHKGDALSVQASRPDLISHDDVGSFFGLFRIGD